jgi:hypothetical protein
MIPQDDKETLHPKYVRLVRRYPPEHFPDKFKMIQNAYHELTLSDSIIVKLMSEYKNLKKNKVDLAAFLWADRLELSVSESHSDNLETFLSEEKGWEEKKEIIDGLSSSHIEYRKVDL